MRRRRCGGLRSPSPPTSGLPDLLLDVDEVPAILVAVGEDEQGVGVLSLQPGDDGTLGGQEEAGRVEAGVDDLEAVVVTGSGEEDRIPGEQASLALGPLLP
jgi:hypothetical protein